MVRCHTGHMHCDSLSSFTHALLWHSSGFSTQSSVQFAKNYVVVNNVAPGANTGNIITPKAIVDQNMTTACGVVRLRPLCYIPSFSCCQSDRAFLFSPLLCALF